MSTSLTVPVVGSSTWDAPLNSNWTMLNSILFTGERRQAHLFSGADASEKIIAAEADLPASGGVVDALGFGATDQVLSASMAIGSLTKPVVLLVSHATHFAITLNNSAADLIRLGNCSALICNGFGKSPQFELAATASVNSIIAPYDRTGHQESMFVAGINLSSLAGAAIASAAIDIQGIFTNTIIRDVYTYDLPTCVLRVRPGTGAGGGLKICSDIKIDNCNLAGNFASCQPVLIEGAAASGVGNILFDGGAIQFQGAGKRLVYINGHGIAGGITHIRFRDVDFETGNNAPHANTIDIVDAAHVIIDGLLVSGTVGTNLVSLSETVPGLTHDCEIKHLWNSQGWTNSINDSVSGRLLKDAHIAHYPESKVYKEIQGSAAVGTTALFTPDANGFYEIKWFLNTSQVPSGGGSSAVQLTLSWKCTAVTTLTKVGANLNANTLTQYDEGAVRIYCVAGQPVTFATSYASSGSPAMNYQLYIGVKAL